MVKPHGISNKNAIQQLANSISGSGILRATVDTEGNKLFDVNQPVALLQKTSALVTGAGRLQFAKNVNYVPAYTLGIGASVGSGYTTPSVGIYQVDAEIAVSGVVAAATVDTPDAFIGQITVDGIAVLGTATSVPPGKLGEARVLITGIVHAKAGQVINAQVKSVITAMKTIGSEDLGGLAPAAKLRVIKLGSDELTQTGS